MRPPWTRWPRAWRSMDFRPSTVRAARVMGTTSAWFAIRRETAWRSWRDEVRRRAGDGLLRLRHFRGRPAGLDRVGLARGDADLETLDAMVVAGQRRRTGGTHARARGIRQGGYRRRRNHAYLWRARRRLPRHCLPV